ncbi:MAG: hypothetical protein Tp1125DCM00d2C21254131_23 [Prokaryotic dsDNA virus sp.]|nr:MAG: hypothetical protein Tp1125DCM00d2C21254131_23 [Prokaryotic dsDNA virus sp.]|tara:strand:+ start:599 stop:826 length:228 start_codon:yes stop_codon:yes gene_type:complete
MKFNKLGYEPPERKLVAVLYGDRLLMRNEDGTALMVIQGGVCREYGGQITTLEGILGRYINAKPIYEGDKMEVTF